MCTLTAAPTSITTGNSSVIKWTSSNAVSGTIDQGIGAITLTNTAGRSVTPASTKTYTMTVTNSAGATATCAAAVTVTTVVPAPTCTLTATPTSIVSGNSSQLKWTSTNAVSGTIDQGVGTVNPTNTAGVRSVSPTASKTYTLTVLNSAGASATCIATVSVRTVVPAPTCTLTATPTSITTGNSSTIKWTTTNAVSGTIDQGIGAIVLTNTAGRSVTPASTKTYTMTVTNSAGATATCAASVSVTTPTPDAPVCDYFRANPVTINRGDSATLTWATTRATSVSINNGVGSVAVDGSYTVSPLENTTYTLIANGAGGTTNCAVPVTVVQPHNNLTCSQNVRFYADDNSITEGDRTTLHWDTTDVTSVSITDLGSVSVDGSQSVSPSSDRTYNLTASNGSDTVTCPVTIDVEEEHHSGGGSSNSPRCELTISDGTITLGERVTVKWTSSYASDIILKDSDGKTLVTTEDRLSSDKRELYDGDITLRPEKNTTYTLIAKTSSRTKECKVNVVVSGAVVVSQIRDQQPLVSGIALTQVPYTGFEAGPIMTFFFFGLLALWALYLAYVLVVRRSGEMVAVAAAGTVVSDTATPGHGLFSTITPTPVFHQPTVVTPVVETAAIPVVGYGTAVVADEVTLAIENHAHAAHVLLSGDALRSFVDATASATDRMATLDAVLAAAKGAYPAEDGWVVLGEERMNALLTA